MGFVNIINNSKTNNKSVKKKQGRNPYKSDIKKDIYRDDNTKISEIRGYAEARASIKIDGLVEIFEINKFSYLEEISSINPITIEIIDALFIIDEKISNKNVEIFLKIEDHVLLYSKEYREKKIFGYIKVYSIERMKTVLGYKKNIIKIKVYPFVMKLNNAFKRKIFHNKNIIEIIEDIFKNRNFEDYTLSLKKQKNDYEKKYFLIQYDENDLDFILRLLETNGFFYYNFNIDNKQNFMISDRSNIQKNIAGNELELVDEISTHGNFKEIICPKIYQNKKEIDFFLIHDYNYEKSNLNLSKKSSNSGLNIYETNYNFDYSSTKEADAKINQFVNQSKFKSQIFSFRTRRILELFNKFKVKDSLEGAAWAKGEYYVYRILMKYSKKLCIFKVRSVSSEFIFIKKPYHKKPKIIGSHLAVVIGKSEDSKEEVFVDKFATVLIKFMWEQTDEKKSSEPGIKVRVSQLIGGKSGNSGICGIWAIPRIGQEVTVTFINGDPDRPLITGVVLNSDNLSIFDKEGIQNGLKKIAIKTATIPNGKDGHEFIFDDEKDKQKITLLSSKDLELFVNNDTLFELKNNYDTNVEKGNYSLTMKKGNINITLDKGGINIKSADNIKIVCDKELNIKAKKISMVSETSIESKAQSIESKAEKNIQFNCQSFQMKALQSFKFEGSIGEIKVNSKFDLTGALVNFQSNGIFNIKSSGPLNLNGAIISLN
jgi:type VI secretion system secreted protein VgrG